MAKKEKGAEVKEELAAELDLVEEFENDTEQDNTEQQAGSDPGSDLGASDEANKASPEEIKAASNMVRQILDTVNELAARRDERLRVKPEPMELVYSSSEAVIAKHLKEGQADKVPELILAGVLATIVVDKMLVLQQIKREELKATDNG